MIKKTVKRNPQTDEPGKIIEQEASIHISNVMFFDKSGKPTRKRPSA
jgi:ribosomal protein L24